MSQRRDTTRAAPEGKLLLDDLWLNEAEHTLRRITKRCEKDFGHKPSLEDFRQLLRVKLAGGAEDYFSDGESVEVVDIVFKTRKRPRTQRYKVGDVFAIRLDVDRYAFGRVMRLPAFEGWGGALVEFFRETSKTNTYHASIVASDRLLHPTDVSESLCLKNRRWTVVASDATYRFSQADQDLEFTVAPALRRDGWHYSAKKPFAPGSPSRAISEDEWRRMEENGQRPGLVRPEDHEDRIRAALKRLERAAPP